MRLIMCAGSLMYRKQNFFFGMNFNGYVLNYTLQLYRRSEQPPTSHTIQYYYYKRHFKHNIFKTFKIIPYKTNKQTA